MCADRCERLQKQPATVLVDTADNLLERALGGGEVGELAAQGKAILVVSSYLPELLGICDRLGVMCRGKLSAIRLVNEWTEEGVMAFATGS